MTSYGEEYSNKKNKKINDRVSLSYMYYVSIMVCLLPRYSGISSRDLCSDRLVLWGGGNTALKTAQLGRLADSIDIMF